VGKVVLDPNVHIHQSISLNLVARSRKEKGTFSKRCEGNARMRRGDEEWNLI